MSGTPDPQRGAHPNAASPPSKRDLKSWWKGFKLAPRHQEPTENRPRGIFGVPLRQSITYANVAISLIDENGKSYIYGYVPIVVAKCGVFLKEKATGIEGIFRLSGSEKRIKELKNIFDSPDRYGKGLVWEGYTVHDAANVFRRYLNDLPEPVVPLDLYQKFREPLKGATKQAVGDAEGPQLVDDFDEHSAIIKYQQLITELPPLNRQLLLYILDLLAVFAAKADENRMNSQNLAAIFQPGMLSHPDHAMAPEEYRLNQCVIIFLIENQDHFLIGMQGTATDEQTKEAIEKGTPPLTGPTTPTPNRRTTGLGRSASNASAGADSIRRDGKVRRNRSVSSRHSRNDGSTTPNSPGLIATPTSGLGRSNTVPSKKSPNLQTGRFFKGDTSPASSPKGPALHEAMSPTTGDIQAGSQQLPPNVGATFLTPGQGSGVGRSSDRLLEPPQEVITPSKERNLQTIFQRTPSGEDKRQPNKLKKKRAPSSVNPSAQSSTTSLHATQSVTPSSNLEGTNPLDQQADVIPEDAPAPAVSAVSTPAEAQSDETPRASHVPSNTTLQPENNLGRSKSPPTSVHSSFNEGSDQDPVDPPTNTSNPEVVEKEKKSRWRLSRSIKKEDTSSIPADQPSPRFAIGSNENADVSNTSIGSSANRPRKSFTGESSDPASSATDVLSAQDGREGGKDESKGPIGWIRNKYREAKENREERRAKSPPAGDSRQSTGLSAVILPNRGKSLDIKRDDQQRDQKQEPSRAPAIQEQPPTPAETKAPAEQQPPLPQQAAAPTSAPGSVPAPTSAPPPAPTSDAPAPPASESAVPEPASEPVPEPPASASESGPTPASEEVTAPTVAPTPPPAGETAADTTQPTPVPDKTTNNAN